MIVGVFLLIAWLVLLLKYPAKALPVSLAALCALGIVAAVVAWQQTRLDHQLAGLDISLNVDTRQCPATTPLFVTVRNTQDAPLITLSWRTAAYFPGDRNDLAANDYSRPQYSAPHAIPPGEAWTTCLPVPPLRDGYRAETLQYRAEALEGSFD
ncbi:multidrug transporter [Pseudomonas matsuisoli]|uniref:Multidrug transporter n=1 Tax=Pseudomonas matsuisoli TaxID=1515666 RepID=A0A917USR0_9PSED|nr:multidrug transporter [Pseudomonas matsuisoli]GGJ82693.1 hypothetical protein GCM10009304_05880 [Pseudomonas matsuisoli]